MSRDTRMRGSRRARVARPHRARIGRRPGRRPAGEIRTDGHANAWRPDRPTGAQTARPRPTVGAQSAPAPLPEIFPRRRVLGVWGGVPESRRENGQESARELARESAREQQQQQQQQHQQQQLQQQQQQQQQQH